MCDRGVESLRSGGEPDPERHKNSAQELWYTKVVQYLHMVSTMGNNHTASCAIVV